MTTAPVYNHWNDIIPLYTGGIHCGC